MRSCYFSCRLLLLAIFLVPSVNAEPVFKNQTVLENEQFVVDVIASGFGRSWGLALLPEQKMLLGEQKTGKVWLLDNKQQQIYLVATIKDIYTRGQAGLFSIRADRDFLKNKKVYLARSVSQGSKSTTQLITAELKDQKLQNLRVLFTALPYVNDDGHYGGALAQDSHGHLYLSVGERHQRLLVQKLDNHLGKILRLDNEGAAVTDNPFNGKGLSEIFSYGHRNPQGLYWSDKRQQLWAAEHGPKGGDEINLIESGSNYGWPIISYGKEYSGGPIGIGTAMTGMEQPVYYYVPSIATSDLVLYEHATIQQFQGNILQASLKAGVISQLELDKKGSAKELQRFLGKFGERWRSIKIDDSGSIYLLAESGKLYRISSSTLGKTRKKK